MNRPTKASLTSRIFEVIERQGYITNRDFENISFGLSHSGRNRITEQEAKDYFRGKGLKVSRCHLGKTVMENRWNLEPISGAEAQATNTQSVECSACATERGIETPLAVSRETAHDRGQRTLSAPYHFPGIQTCWGEILQEAQRA